MKLYTLDPEQNVPVDQVAISAHDAIAPPALAFVEPMVGPLSYGVTVSFLHIVASLRQPNNIQKEENFYYFIVLYNLSSNLSYLLI